MVFRCQELVLMNELVQGNSSMIPFELFHVFSTAKIKILIVCLNFALKSGLKANIMKLFPKHPSYSTTLFLT